MSRHEIEDTPAWVDDTRAVRRADLTTDDVIAVPCADHVDDHARACYQAVEFPHASAFFQLLDRHDLTAPASEADAPRTWVRADGLTIEPQGKHADITEATEPGRRPYVSYLDAFGPADGVAAFVEDLLILSPSIKRELRAPARRPAANAAKDANRRVRDVERLVDRALSASTVRRLPAADSDDGGETA